MLVIWYDDNREETPFLKVFSLTHVERSVLAAQAAGVERVLVVTGDDQCESVASVLRVNPGIQADFEVLSALPNQLNAPEISILFGNQVCTAQGMTALVQPLENDEGARAVHNSAGMSGAFRLTASIFDRLHITSDSTPGDIASFLETEDITISSSGDGNYLAEMDGNHALAEAEALLIRSLVKDADGVISRNINRKISLFISKRLARTSVVPNQVTVIVFLVGICSGLFAFFMNSYYGFLIGAFCYYLSAILDGCDGELARLKYLGSPLGVWLDTVVDDLVGFSYILGLYARLALDSEGPWWTWIGAVTMLMYLITILPRYWVMANTGSGDYQKLAAKRKTNENGGFTRLAEGVRNVIFRTDFLPFYAFVTAAAGYVVVFAIPFSIGSVASAVDSVVTAVNVKRYQR